MKQINPKDYDNDITRVQHNHHWVKSYEHPNREFCYECMAYRDIPFFSVVKKSSVTTDSKELGLPKKSSTQEQRKKILWSALEIFHKVKLDRCSYLTEDYWETGKQLFMQVEILRKCAKGHLSQDTLSGNWYLELNTEMIESLGLSDKEEW